MGRHGRGEAATGAEAEALERYRQARRRGLPTRALRAGDGPRMRAKAASRWKGARFSAVIMAAGVLSFLSGVVLLALATGVRVAVSGLYFAGLGAGITVGHPISVVLARRRWSSRLTGDEVDR